MKFFERIAAIFFPHKCIFCGQILGTDTMLDICSACFKKLPFAEEKLIEVCSENSGDTHIIDPVDAGPYELGCDNAICIFKYTGIVKESLIRFKFYNRPSYFRTYVKLLAERLWGLTDVGSYDMIISVPLHKKKELARGYNQAYLISSALSREIGVPERSQLLERSRYTDTQSLLDRSERQKNVKGAFRVTDTAALKNKSVLLVDDIMTTGFTLNECARMLKEAGAAVVTAAVVASGRATSKVI